MDNPLVKLTERNARIALLSSSRGSSIFAKVPPFDFPKFSNLKRVTSKYI